MAIRVPTPETQGPQRLGGIEAAAADTPYQQLQMPDMSFNARMLQQLGGALGSISRTLFEQSDNEALLEAQRDRNDWLNGVFDPTDGVLTQTGANAAGVSDRTALSADEFAAEMERRYGDRLTRTGRLALAQMLETTGQTAINRAISHETTARRSYQAELLQGNIDDALIQIGRDPLNDEHFDAQLSRILSSGDRAAEISGNVGGDLAETRRIELTTTAVAARVASVAATGDTAAAVGLLERYADQIDPETFNRLIEPLRNAARQDRALRAAETAALLEAGELSPFIPGITTPRFSGTAEGSTARTFGSEIVVQTRGGVVMEEELASPSDFLRTGAEVTLRDVIEGPFQELQRRMGMAIIINDALPRPGTGRADPESPDYQPDSQHWHGTALDIDISGMTHGQRLRLVREAVALGFRGFGFGNGYMHIDMREGGTATWQYGLTDQQVADGVAVPGWQGLNMSALTALVNGAPAGEWDISRMTGPGAGSAFINSIVDPRERQLAQQAYSAQVSFDNTAMLQQRATLMTDIYTQVETDYANGEIGNLSDYLTQEVIAALGDQADDVRTYINNIRSGGARVTDQTVYDDLYSLLTTSDPARAEERNAALLDPTTVLSQRGNLSVVDYRTLSTLHTQQAAELRGQQAATVEAQQVDTVMANATRTRINAVLQTQLSAYSGLDSRDDAAALAAMLDQGYTAVRRELSARLSAMSDAERQIYEGESGVANMEELITQVARELTATDAGFIGDDIGRGFRLDDDVSMLQLMTTIDDSEITVDQLMDGSTQLVIPIGGVGDVAISTETINFVAEQMEAAGVFISSPSQILEQVYSLSRAYLVAGDAAMLGEVERSLQEDIAAAQAPAPEPTPRPSVVTPEGVVTGDQVNLTEAEIAEIDEAAYWEQTEAYDYESDREGLAFWNSQVAQGAEPPYPQANRSFNWLMALQQALGNSSEPILLQADLIDALLSNPMRGVIPQSMNSEDYMVLQQRLSGTQGLRMQTLAVSEAINLFIDFRGRQ